MKATIKGKHPAASTAVVIVTASLALMLAGCQSMPGAQSQAIAELKPTQGNRTAGQVRFTQADGKVRVHATVMGLKPNQEHGFHIHEAGDCSSGDGMSAKGHFNPQSSPHGHYSTPMRHTGDMPNLRADGEGRAEAQFELDLMTLGTGENSIGGRGVIVHAQPDDYKSQPVGNAGARLACGVIMQQ